MAGAPISTTSFAHGPLAVISAKVFHTCCLHRRANCDGRSNSIYAQRETGCCLAIGTRCYRRVSPLNVSTLTLSSFRTTFSRVATFPNRLVAGTFTVGVAAFSTYRNRPLVSSRGVLCTT